MPAGSLRLTFWSSTSLKQRVGGGGQQAPDRAPQAVPDRAGCGFALDPEDAAHDHVKGHRRHTRRQRERLTERPAVDLAFGHRRDHVHVALDRFTVEGREQQLALAHVACADRGQNRVGAEDRPQRRLTRQRRSILGLGLHQRAHVVGMAGDHEPLFAREDLQLPHVSVATVVAEVGRDRPDPEADRLQPRRGGIPGRQARDLGVGHGAGW